MKKSNNHFCKTHIIFICALIKYVSFLSMLFFIPRLSFATRIEQATLKRMSKFQVIRQLIQARKLNDSQLVEQLKERLAIMPDDPPPKPLDAGEGRYYWLPRYKDGTGEWIWQDESGRTIVVSQTLAASSGQTLSKPTIQMPTEPPKAAKGPGRWIWHSEGNGEGEVIWIPENREEKPIAGPRTPGAQGVPDLIRGPEAVVQEKIVEIPEPTGAPQPPVGGPPAPGGEGPPVPTVPGGGPPSAEPTGPAKPTPPKKLTIKDRILKDRPILSEQELNNLSQAEKDASDKIFIDAINKIAHEVYIRPENDQTTEAQVGRMRKTFDNPFEAYRWFILETLIQDVGMNKAFKKRDELLALIGETEQEPGSLLRYIDASLKKTGDLEPFLRNIDNKLNQLTDELRVLMAKSTFAIQDVIQKIKKDIETLIVDVAITQRPSVATKKIKVRGDYKSLPDPTPVQRVLNRGRMYRFIFDYVQELLAAADRNPLVPLRDKRGNMMIPVLRNRLNRLRLDPEFFRFDQLSGSKLREQVAGKGGIEAIKLLPLIDWLDLYDEKYLSFFAQPFNIIMAMMNQLYFDYTTGQEQLNEFINKNAKFLLDNLEEAQKEGWTEDAINDVILQSNIFKQAVEEYYDKLKTIIAERKKSIDPYETINEPLKDVLQYEDIEKILSFLKSVAGTPERNKIIDVIIKELKNPKKRFAPDADMIIVQLKKLTGKQQLAFEENIRKRIKSFIDKNKNAALIVDILEQGIKDKKAPLVAWMIEEFTKNNVPIKKYEKELKGVRRTPIDVYGALGGLAGRTNISKVIKDKNFYKLVAPYGLLMIIFENWSEQADKKQAKQMLDALYRSLELLDSKNKLFPKGEADLYVKNLGNYTDIIYIRNYADKLNELIAALKESKLNDVRVAAEKLISNAKTGAEKTVDFDTLIKKFQRAFAVTSLKEVVDFLKELNKGQAIVTIPGIDVNKYAHIYINLKGLLDNLITLLTNQDGTVVAPENIDPQKVTKAVRGFISQARKVIAEDRELKKEGKEAERTRVDKALSEYMLSLVNKIDQIKNGVPESVSDTSEVIIPSEGPPLPPTGGGPPSAPTSGGPPPIPGGSGPPIPKT